MEKMKTLSMRLENGKKIFSIDCILDAERRAVPVKVPVDNQGETKPATKNEGALPGDAGRTIHQDPFNAASDVRDTWRLISAVQVWPTSHFWTPQLIDYSHNNGAVLKDVVGLVNSGKVDLTWNHSIDARDVAGHIENSYWEDSTDIPPGVNADLVVDPEFDAKAAIGLKKQVIRNGSIGISMEMEPSHPDMDFEKFVLMQGQEVGGKTVRWLPERITNVRHMALLSGGTGADPNAGHRQTDNSAVLNHTEQQRSENGMPEKLTAILLSICSTLGLEFSFSEETIPENLEEKLTEKIEKLKLGAALSNKLTSKLHALGDSLLIENELNLSAEKVLDRLPVVIELSKAGEKFIEFQRIEALRQFDAAKVDPDSNMSETDKRIRGRIEASSDLDFLSDSIEEYRSLAGIKFGRLDNQTSERQKPATDEQNLVGRNYDIAKSASEIFEKRQK